MILILIVNGLPAAAETHERGLSPLARQEFVNVSSNSIDFFTKGPIQHKQSLSAKSLKKRFLKFSRFISKTSSKTPALFLNLYHSHDVHSFISFHHNHCYIATILKQYHSSHIEFIITQ
jgi:hypothetical protein